MKKLASNLRRRHSAVHTKYTDLAPLRLGPRDNVHAAGCGAVLLIRRDRAAGTRESVIR
jgi:hypothetical protein